MSEAAIISLRTDKKILQVIEVINLFLIQSFYNRLAGGQPGGWWSACKPPTYCVLCKLLEKNVNLYVKDACNGPFKKMICVFRCKHDFRVTKYSYFVKARINGLRQVVLSKLVNTIIMKLHSLYTTSKTLLVVEILAF